MRIWQALSPEAYAARQDGASRSLAIDSRVLLWLVIALSLIGRIAAAFYMGDRVVELPGTADQVSYHELALRVLAGNGFSFGEAWWPATAANAPTAHWSYLYTLFVTAVYAIFGPHPLVARLIQALIVGVLHPYLAYRLAARVLGRPAGRSGSQAIPLLAAGLTAVYAYFVYYSATLMTEAFYIVGILSSLYFSVALAGDGEDRTNLRVLGLGLSLAVTVLLRQLFLVLVPFILLWIALGQHAGGWRRIAWKVALPLGIVVLAILPFTLYNQSRFGHFVLLNTNAGYAFYWGNHPIYGTEFLPILPAEMGSYQELIPPELLGLDEAALDQALLRRGLGFVADDPQRYILLSLSRIKAYFKFWPDAESGPLSNLLRVGSFGLLLPFMLYGLLRAIADGVRSSRAGAKGAGRRIRQWVSHPLSLLLLLLVLYTGIHLASWALIRYRLPVDAVLVLCAAYGIADLMARAIRTLRSRRLGVAD